MIWKHSARGDLTLKDAYALRSNIFPKGYGPNAFGQKTFLHPSPLWFRD